MTTKQLSTLALVLMALSSQSFAAKHEGSHQRDKPQRPEFSSIDLDSDGIVSIDEFKQHRIPHGCHDDVFANIDSNEDGQITEQEFTNHKPPRRPRG